MTDQMVQGSVPAVQNQGKEVPVVNQIKSMLSTDNVQKRFGGSPGKESPSVHGINHKHRGGKQAAEASVRQHLSSGQHLWRQHTIFRLTVTWDSPPIVPYNENVYDPRTKQWKKVPKAQFQMMYKGFIQLAIRSGYYEKMNYAVVYEDELESYNPITGEVKFVEDRSKCTPER